MTLQFKIERSGWTIDTLAGHHPCRMVTMSTIWLKGAFITSTATIAMTTVHSKSSLPDARMACVPERAPLSC